MKFDVARFIDGLHGWLGEQFAPIVDRLKRLEAVPVVDESSLTKNVSKALDPRFLEIYELVGAIQTSVKEIALTPGPKGEDGAPGAPGTDADSAAIKSAVLEEVRAAQTKFQQELSLELRALAKPGRDGEDGQDGEDGKDAEIPETLIRELIDARVKELPRAADGKSVPIEDVQRMVDDAVQKRMADIRMPSDGNDGRDALHLEILAGIDLSKNYPRNTYAKHLGGLWRSFEKTHDMRGWECIVNGVAGVEYQPSEEDPRVLAAKTILSDGTESIAVIRVPAMVYKGVFREGEEYEQGDTVTWGGSLWHCQEPTREKPAESGVKSWRLAVKKGRDAPQNAPTPIDPSKSVRL
jgi:hypothetical protein